MPKTEEYAEIVVNGQRFRDWESVSVQIEFHTAARIAQFTVSEEVSKGLSFQNLQIKPGDACEIFLAGQKVLTGKVFARQASYDANAHSVILSAISNSQELVHGSIEPQQTQYRGYNFEQIARGLMQPFGVNLQMVHQSSYSAKIFKEVGAFPGEPVFDFLDRLAKLRGMFIRDDAGGNLVVGGGSTESAGDFVEGENIKSASCTVRDDTIKSKTGVIGDRRGDDQTDGETARKPSASAKGSYQGHRPHIILSEETGDSEDFAARADHENRWLLGRTIECDLVVYGWLKSGGTLWDVEDSYTVTSPMLLLDKALLGPQSITFTQDSNSGTQTTFIMVRPDARHGEIGPVQAPAGDGGGLPGGDLQPAQPDTLNP